MKTKLTFTLKSAVEAHACTEGIEKLVSYFNNTLSETAEINLLTLLKSNGVQDALWALRCVLQPELSLKISIEISKRAADRAATYASITANDTYAYATAAHTAVYADRAAAYATNGADNAAAAAAYAAYAAYVAAADAAASKSDQILFDFAEQVSQILIDMKVPGVEWLDLL